MSLPVIWPPMLIDPTELKKEIELLKDALKKIAAEDSHSFHESSTNPWKVICDLKAIARTTLEGKVDGRKDNSCPPPKGGTEIQIPKRENSLDSAKL